MIGIDTTALTYLIGALGATGIFRAALFFLFGILVGVTQSFFV